MIVKTSTLTGDTLDRLVSHCKEWSKPFPIMPLRILSYSTDWNQGGPIIDRERIATQFWVSEGEWEALIKGGFFASRGPTPLIAAMRCYVTSVLGDEVEIPEEFL